ncbi:hypothetical protein OKW49_005301 [Paraburkholderia youngii]|uniref:hypothetical protein n=1 Tax=Paraburkholderia youngii TaxID=2782701 RepID=UPI003D2301A9
MSTKATLAHHHSESGEPSWHFYEEVFEMGVVYLEFQGVAVELRTRMGEQGGADLVVRLPIETARQLGLPTNVSPEKWECACGHDKFDTADSPNVMPIERLRGSVLRYDNPTDPALPPEQETD